MTDKPAGFPLAAILYFVAAALAWGAFAIRYAADREVQWYLLAAGLFCAVMGYSVLTRARRPGA